MKVINRVVYSLWTKIEEIYLLNLPKFSKFSPAGLKIKKDQEWLSEL